MLQRMAGTARVLSRVVLLAGSGLVAFDDLVALTMGTEHGDEHHFDLLYEKASVWHTCGESANLKHYPREKRDPVARDGAGV